MTEDPNFAIGLDERAGSHFGINEDLDPSLTNDRINIRGELTGKAGDTVYLNPSAVAGGAILTRQEPIQQTVVDVKTIAGKPAMLSVTLEMIREPTAGIPDQAFYAVDCEVSWGSESEGGSGQHSTRIWLQRGTAFSVPCTWLRIVARNVGNLPVTVKGSVAFGTLSGDAANPQFWFVFPGVGGGGAPIVDPTTVEIPNMSRFVTVFRRLETSQYEVQQLTLTLGGAGTLVRTQTIAGGTDYIRQIIHPRATHIRVVNMLPGLTALDIGFDLCV